MAEPLSVSQALALVKGSLEQISATIVGEVSEVSDKAGYKAVYFTISDKSAALSCLMWRSLYQSAGVDLKQGMLVEISGVFSVYAAKGRMNFDARTLRLAGEGELRIKVAQLAQKLASEGLMSPERKRPVPRFPAAIAVVTSPRGKAIHDVLRTLRRRYPLAEVLVAGVAVEGATAAQSIIEGLSIAQKSHAELILLVRGGGSYEDLMPFNDELLARAVAASKVPVITGIGHEPDNSIADMVADYRASTPTAAAEHVTPDINELKASLAGTEGALNRLLAMRLQHARGTYERLRDRALFLDPITVLRSYSMAAEGTAHRLYQQLPLRLQRDRQLVTGAKTRMALLKEGLLKPFETQVKLSAAHLNALSPLAVLGRGYSISYDSEGHVIDSIHKIEPGQQLGVRLVDGLIECQVEGKRLQQIAGFDRKDRDV